MYIRLDDAYNAKGEVHEHLADILQGTQRQRQLTPSVNVTHHTLKASKSAAFIEETHPGVYLSFISQDLIPKPESIGTLQLSLVEKTMCGGFHLIEGESRCLFQLCIQTEQLAHILQEDTTTVINSLRQSIARLGHNGILHLPVTTDLIPLLVIFMDNQRLTSLRCLAKSYELVLSSLEKTHVLMHLLTCQDCQNKLFQAQNLLEATEAQSISVSALSQAVDLSIDALELGFFHIVGVSLTDYIDQIRTKYAATLLRQQLLTPREVCEKTGLSETQLNGLFLRHFGMPTSAYSQLH